jgi:hypothetical protein
MRKVFWVIPSVLMGLLGVYAFQQTFAINEYCSLNKTHCLQVRGGWKSASLMNTLQGLYLLNKGIPGIHPENQMDIYFLSNQEVSINSALANQPLFGEYEFGKAVKITEQVQLAQNIKVPDFFKNGVYIPDQAVVIRCDDLRCLNSIVSIK